MDVELKTASIAYETLRDKGIHCAKRDAECWGSILGIEARVLLDGKVVYEVL